MASLNKVCLLGNVGRDVEVRYTQAGEPIANFSLALSEKWTAKDGTKQERTEWVRVEVFGKLAQIARDYVTKGKQLYVEGSLATDEWTDREGKKRQTTKVKLSGPFARLILLGGKSEDKPAPAEASEPHHISDEDVPF